MEGEDLIQAAWKGPQATEHTRIPIGKGVCGLAALTREVVNVTDVTKDPRYMMCFPGTRSEIMVPILGSHGLLGQID
ncbi:MAG: GAF domain-containing protein, partial [Thermoplasmata archaeon]